SSSNTEVLSVLEWAPGYFNAIAPGTSTVTVTVGEVSDSIEVEVYEAPVEKITLDKTEATILTVETHVLNATTDPKEHTDGNIQWSSSDETVVTAAMGTNTSGTVTPVGVGEATVTAKVGNASVTCKVTVKEPEEGTVIWKYDGNARNGWPQNMSASYGIGALIMNGAKFDSVAEENGVQIVTLPHATAKDAEISLKVYACGAYPQNLGVNWHEGEVNPQSWNDYANELEHTFKLVDGEATLKIRAYKASGAGASREGTKTFKFVVGGECTFDQKVASEEHLAAEATCTEAATYYMSCVCGANGTETFSDGEAPGHDYEGVVTAEATCTEPGVMTYTCKTCGDSYTEEIAVNPEAHKVSEKWTYENDKHFHICENGCGKRFDEAECSGGKATCSAKAICEVCGNKYGEIDSDNHAFHYETVTEPGCETEGERKITCENGCGYEKNEVIEALGHEWSEWEVVKEASYTEEGSKKRVCENDESHVETETIEKLVPTATEKVDGYHIAYQEDVVIVPENLNVTVQDIKDALTDKVENGSLKGEVVVTFMEATIGYIDDNNNFVPIDSEEYFKDGKTIDITLPYPKDGDADKNDNFEVYHYLDDGNIEKCEIKSKTDKGLVIEVDHLSPFVIAYQGVSNVPSKPSKPVKPSDKDVITIVIPEEKAEESNPNTGAPVLYSFDLTAAGVVVLAATATLLKIKRKK
ncbi:MAG: Ig domain-containing protein, partial [Oscillospiraceae bacterium]|nr:Ig domain-containing protein [Oscillospiraceae bacterium]